MTLEELAAALQKADRPSKELDRHVGKAFGWHRVEPRHTRSKHGGWISPDDWIGSTGDGAPILDSLHGTTIHRDVPNYTSSIDAAVALMNAVLPGAEYEISTLYGPASVSLPLNSDSRVTVDRADGHVALALCAAIVAAKIAEQKP